MNTLQTSENTEENISIVNKKETHAIPDSDKHHDFNLDKKDSTIFDEASKLYIRPNSNYNQTIKCKLKDREIFLINSLKTNLLQNTLCLNPQVRIMVPGVVCAIHLCHNKLGKPYIKFELTSLQPTFENFRISAFLFGESHKKNITTELGTLVYFLDPKIDAASENNIVLIPKSCYTVIPVGQAVDYATCKGVRVKDGNPCKRIVNKRNSFFCESHYPLEVECNKSTRVELKSFCPKPMIKLSSDPEWNAIRPYNKIFPCQPSNIPNIDEKSLKAYGKPTKSLKDYMNTDSPGTRNLLKQLNSSELTNPSNGQGDVKVSDFMKNNFEEPKKRKYTSEAILNLIQKANTTSPLVINDTPTLGDQLRMRAEDSSPVLSPAPHNESPFPNFSASSWKFKPLTISNTNSQTKKNNSIESNMNSSTPMLPKLDTQIYSRLSCKTCKHSGAVLDPECYKNKHKIITLRICPCYFICLTCDTFSSSYEDVQKIPCTYCGGLTFERISADEVFRTQPRS